MPPHKGARQPGELCPHCTDLLAYAEARLARCRFGEDKPVCSQCPVHCFKPTRREEIRVVMRYVGPRMARRRPYLALMHLWDRRRRAPVHAKAFSDALSQPREPESKELAAQADSVNG
ncbi:MAG: nitrous oxide-stimulated promoter family protein [Thermoleophilia bacterium]|nr:nitrous oxide-stimulated promoter family protein [Thermoleophilia bacterium]